MRLAPFGVGGTAPRVNEFAYLIGNDVRECGRGGEFNPAAFSPHSGARPSKTHTLGEMAILLLLAWSSHSQVPEASGV